MRHANRIKKLGRTSAHRKATLAALSSALLEHKRITTTLPKAKALRSFVEPIINRAKDDTTHNRRQAFRRLRNKEAVKTLFGEVAEVLGSRPGGYTRVVKLGQRSGDAAEMAIIELVDFNDVKPEGASVGKKKTRRSRRKSTDAVPAAISDDAVVDEATTEAEDTIEAAEEEVAEVSEEATAEVEEEVLEAAEVEEVAEEEVAEPAAEVEEVAEQEVAEPAAEVEETAEEEIAEPAAEVEEVTEEEVAEPAAEVEEIVEEEVVEPAAEVEEIVEEEVVEPVAEVEEVVEEAAAEEAAPEAEAEEAPSGEAEADDEGDEEKGQ